MKSANALSRCTSSQSGWTRDCFLSLLPIITHAKTTKNILHNRQRVLSSFTTNSRTYFNILLLVTTRGSTARSLYLPRPSCTSSTHSESESGVRPVRLGPPDWLLITSGCNVCDVSAWSTTNPRHLAERPPLVEVQTRTPPLL